MPTCPGLTCQIPEVLSLLLADNLQAASVCGALRAVCVRLRPAAVPTTPVPTSPGVASPSPRTVAPLSAPAIECPALLALLQTRDPGLAAALMSAAEALGSGLAAHRLVSVLCLQATDLAAAFV